MICGQTFHLANLFATFSGILRVMSVTDCSGMPDCVFPHVTVVSFLFLFCCSKVLFFLVICIRAENHAFRSKGVVKMAPVFFLFFFLKNGCRKVGYFLGAVFIFHVAGIFSNLLAAIFCVFFGGAFSLGRCRKNWFLMVLLRFCSGWECAFFPRWGA